MAGFRYARNAVHHKRSEVLYVREGVSLRDTTSDGAIQMVLGHRDFFQQPARPDAIPDEIGRTACPVHTRDVARLVPRPSHTPSARLAFERHVYTVIAAVVLVRPEEDSDLHVVLQQRGNQMITEAPAPSCDSHATPTRRRQMPGAQPPSALRSSTRHRSRFLRLRPRPDRGGTECNRAASDAGLHEPHRVERLPRSADARRVRDRHPRGQAPADFPCRVARSLDQGIDLASLRDVRSRRSSLHS